MEEKMRTSTPYLTAAAIATAAAIVAAIAVGGGPSGPSIEGPFCRAVHLCRALGDGKIEKKK